MNGESRELLIEAAVTAFREHDRDGRTIASPAWSDLPEDAREELFERQLLARRIERALDPRGQSGTVNAVMRRLLGF